MIKLKYFIGYIDDYNIKPFSIFFLKITVYIKRYDGGTKWMYFLIEGDDLLKKYSDIWNKVSNSIKNNLIGKSFTIKHF